MSSNEEYLDNLLKSLTDGDGSAETVSSSVQASADNVQEKVTSAAPAEEVNKAMSMEEIEAMFASMGATTAVESPAEEPTQTEDDLLSDVPGMSEESREVESVLGEESLPDELALDESMLPDELALDESMMSDESALDEGMLPDELVLDESMMSDESALDEGTLPDELALDESMMPDELALDESTLPDELVLDEGTMPDESVPEEEPLSDDFALEEPAEDDMLMEEPVSEEPVTEDIALEETVGEDSSSDDLDSDELSLEELGLDGLGLEEAGQGEAEDTMALSDADSESEETVGLASEESVEEEDAELSALLASMGGDDDLSEINELLEKADQGVSVDDDMLAMLDSASDDDSGDDSFDFFSEEEKEDGSSEDIREITPEELAERENSKSKKEKKKEEKERKKREKAAKKAKGKKDSQDAETAGEGGEGPDGLPDGVSGNEDTPKKQGVFARFLEFLLEEDEEESDGNAADDGAGLGNLSDENKELLAELNAEDAKNAKKKDKKGKKDKKEKKGKKGKKGAEDAADGGDGEEGAEAKPKKPKKEKKKKEKNIEEELGIPDKKLSKKKVTSVFLLCATVAACIVVLTLLLPQQLEKQEARLAFDHNQYNQVYELLYGKKLSEEDEVLLQKSYIILKLQRKLDSYENYKKMGMQIEALDALIEGVSRYQNLRSDAEMYNVGGEVADIYAQILAALASDYGLSESDALDVISSEDDVTYSQRLRTVISGEFFGEEEETAPAGKQDVLPEEEEIIDRLQDVETE